jgi:hypothetical protein
MSSSNSVTIRYTNPGVLVIGFILYISLLIYAFIQYFYLCWQNPTARRISKFNEQENSNTITIIGQKTKSDYSRVFNLTVIFFCILRVSWLSVQTITFVNDASFVLNRVSQSVFFTIFSLIILYWLDMQSSVNSFFSKYRKRIIIATVITNAIVYGLTLITIIMVLRTSSGAITRAQRQGTMYRFSASIISGTALLGNLLFIFVGRGLYNRTKHTSRKAHIPKRAQCFMLSRISIITVILVLCNTLRTVMFLIFPLSNFQIQDSYFYPLAYFIPEILPAVAQLYVALYQKRVQNKSLSIYTKSASMQSNYPLAPEIASIVSSDENYFKINDEDDAEDDVEDHTENKEQTENTN